MTEESEWAVITAPLKHQVAAVGKMMPSRVGALFMDMGTGKSLVVIILASLRREKINKVVWCCPVSLKDNTREQILLHTNSHPEDIHIFDGNTTDANLLNTFWHIVGLESIGGSDRVAMAFNALVDENTMLVVDESSYIKGHRAKRTKRLIFVGERAKYRMVLNGTPISQGIEDLYTQITFLSDRILGYRSWYTFARKHLEYSERYKGMITERKGVEWISARIAPYVYQVTKEECLDLPEKTFANRKVSLTRRQEELYALAKERFMNDLVEYAEEDTGIAIFRMFSALQAIVNGVVPAGFEHEGDVLDTHKTDELLSTLHQLPANSPVVIWVRYRQSVNVVKQALQQEFDANVSCYCGDLSEKKRTAELRRWRERGGYFVATSSCGGIGLTLIEASYGIFYSNGFKYSERLQSEDRLHRIGQRNVVHNVSIWADAGIEDRICTALRNKGDALELFRQEVEQVKELGKDKMMGLLKSL